MAVLHDSRVFFAAERTALAWTRTSLTLMAFGFAIERFGLFMHMLAKDGQSSYYAPSFWFGLVFIGLGCAFSFTSAFQYKIFLKTLSPSDIPACSRPRLAFVLNILISVLAMTMLFYLLLFQS